jgi:hypothetical protein
LAKAYTSDEIFYKAEHITPRTLLQGFCQKKYCLRELFAPAGNLTVVRTNQSKNNLNGTLEALVYITLKH